MGRNNRARLSEALEHLADGLAGPVHIALGEYIGEDWTELWSISNRRHRFDAKWKLHNAAGWKHLPRPVVAQSDKEPASIDSADPYYLLKALTQSAFERAFVGSPLADVAGTDGLAKDLLDLRNVWAHNFSGPDRSVSDGDAELCLQLIEQLLEAVGADYAARTVRRIRLQGPEWDAIEWDYFNEQSRASRHSVALVGREPELARLQHFFTAAAERELLVVGDRYAGKSALLAEAFISPDSDESILLGYFVADPVSERRNATSAAMVRSLVHQVHVILKGEDFVVDSDGSVNSGALAQLLRQLVVHADRENKKVILVIDGIDQDASSSDDDQTIVDVLESLRGIDLKLLVSAWSERIPDRLAGWPCMSIQRNTAVSDKLDRMTAEVESLFEEGELSRCVLRFLTYAGGPFGTRDLAQLCESNPRAIRRIVQESTERLFGATRVEGEGEVWSFAHPKYRDVAESLFSESATSWPVGVLASTGFESDESVTLAKLSAWADIYANAGWPREESPWYLLSEYPRLLAARENLDGLRGLLLDVRYLAAAGERLGSANSISGFADAARRLVSGIGMEQIRDLVMFGSVQSNYLRTPDRLTPASVEAVGAIRAGVGLRDIVIDLVTHEPQPAIDWSFAALAESGHGHAPTNRSLMVRSIAHADPTESVLGEDFWLPGYRLIERARVLRARGDLDAHRSLLSAVQDRASQLDGSPKLHDLATLAMLHAQAGDPASAASLAAEAESVADELIDAGLDSLESHEARQLIYTAGSELATALIWGGQVDRAFVEIKRADGAVFGNDGRWRTEHPTEDASLARATLHESPEVEVTEILERRDPLRDFILALVATGNEDRAVELVNSRVKGREQVLRQITLMLAARMFDDVVALVDQLGGVEDDPSTRRRLVLWKCFLFALIACLSPTEHGREAKEKIRQAVTDAPPQIRHHLARYLCWALAATGEGGDVDGYLDRLSNPYEALIWQMQAALRASSLEDAARVAGHEKWRDRHAPRSARTDALSLLALAEYRQGNVEKSNAVLGDALAVATGPGIGVDISRQETVNAALGRDVDWRWLLVEASESSMRGIAAAALCLPEPSVEASHLTELSRLLPLVQGAAAVRTAAWESDLIPGSDAHRDLMNGLAKLSTIADDSDLWHRAAIAIVDALARAGDHSAVATAGADAFERLLAWYEQGTDVEVFADANLEYGAQLIRLRRLGVELPRDRARNAFRDFAQEYVESVEHSDDEEQELALIEIRAARALIYVALDEAKPSGYEAEGALRSLLDMEASHPERNGWEAALASCLIALAALPNADLDEITKLALNLGVGEVAAHLSSYLLAVGAGKARLILELNLAIGVLRRRPWHDVVDLVRTLEPSILPQVARFEDDLRVSANASIA
ncbi:AAA family ATPase [Microbacterium ureisolvens]|uniref:AAA family ATPase n=1 Tax=Microbacterium ureisolvens TaxID=2781186 RepID=UPI0036455320